MKANTGMAMELIAPPNRLCIIPFDDIDRSESVEKLVAAVYEALTGSRSSVCVLIEEKGGTPQQCLKRLNDVRLWIVNRLHTIEKAVTSSWTAPASITLKAGEITKAGNDYRLLCITMELLKEAPKPKDVLSEAARDALKGLVKEFSSEEIDTSVDNHKERGLIIAALNEHEGNREKAAALLGLSPTTLWRKMKRLGLLAPKLF